MTATLNIPARRAGASDATFTFPYIPKLPWDGETPCTDGTHDPDLWHVSKDDDKTTQEVRAGTAHAKWLCSKHCPVVEKCKEYAITTPELKGVWGGLTSRERSKERAARRLAR
jgi:WhiB family redox-sensing transcriptional regulator